MIKRRSSQLVQDSTTSNVVALEKKRDCIKSGSFVVRGSVDKYRFLSSFVKGKNIDQALFLLGNLAISGVYQRFLKALKQAAHDIEYRYSADIDTILINSVMINKDMLIKRRCTRARGRASTIQKKRSKLTFFFIMAS